MSNVVEKQILEEGPRNAVVKVTGVLDTSDVNLISFIKLSDFSNNDSRQNLVGLRFDAVNYSLGVQIDLLLSWNGNSPQQITPLSRSGKIDVAGEGGALPDQNRSGYDGSINIKSSGYPAGTVQNFTLILHFVKLYKP